MGPGVLEGPHMPTMLSNGNILIYDNGHHTPESSRGFTKVIELKPLTGEIVWEYGSKKQFFSPARGSAVWMENGNTLIVNSDNGWFFEVTPQGEKVWEYYNPDVRGGGSRMGLYRTYAYERESVEKLIRKYGSIYYERKGKETFESKYHLSEKLMVIVKWIETGYLDKAHRYLKGKGLNELGDKEKHFAWSFLYAARKDVEKAVKSARESMKAGMPKAMFTAEFSDLFLPLTNHQEFDDIHEAPQ